MTFSNDIGLPQELVPLLVENWSCEYASLKKDGTPVTNPLIPFPGEDGRTIDVNTGLAYPTKAERARNDPRVCLLYSELRGSAVENPPVVLVYGQATVYDADLQANTDRVVRGYLARMQAPMYDATVHVASHDRLSCPDLDCGHSTQAALVA